MHLVGCLYYLYQWCTVKQISDNEIYMLIKYIKSVIWRVAKRLSYIEDGRCLKVNITWVLLRCSFVWNVVWADDSFVTRSCLRFAITRSLHVRLDRNVDMQHKADLSAKLHWTQFCQPQAVSRRVYHFEHSMVYGDFRIPTKVAQFHFLLMHAACSTPIVGFSWVPPTRYATVQDCKPQSALLPCPKISLY